MFKRFIGIYMTRFLNAYVGRFPDGVLIVRTAWLAEPTEDRTPQPILSEEVREARYFSQAGALALYAAGRLRMHHTRLFIDAAYAELAAPSHPAASPPTPKPE